MPPIEPFNQFIKQKRQEAGLSQIVVAKALSYSNRSNICRLESGELEWKLSSIFKFAELLGIRASELLAEYEEMICQD